jgi:hypothetical protein
MRQVGVNGKSLGPLPCEADTIINFSAVPADVSLASKLTYRLCLILLSLLLLDSVPGRLIAADMASGAPANAAEVRRHAVAILGFDWSDSQTVSLLAEQPMVVMWQPTTIPFLSDSSYSIRAWRVGFTGVSLRLPGYAPDAPDRPTRNLDVYFDSSTGIPLQIRSLLWDLADSGYAKPSVDEAEQQLTNSKETYVGVPSTPPKISFFDALEFAGRGCDPRTAAEIEATYVLHSELQWPVRAVWVIECWGVRSTLFSPDKPTSVRAVVDANTGEMVHVGVIPRLIDMSKATHGK